MKFHLKKILLLLICIFLISVQWEDTLSFATSAKNAKTADSKKNNPEKIAAEQERFFEQKIRPILSTHCFKCHSDKKQEASLRLDSRAAMLAGSDSGQIVVLGKPKESLLVDALHYEGDTQMPPDAKLPAAVIKNIEHWIKIGAPWPKSDSTQKKSLTGEELYQHAKANHWSFQPIRNPVLPKVKGANWCQNPIDYFVLAMLEKAGITASPVANRDTLIRRVYYDLTGLPPTYQEIKNFQNDKRQDAYRRMIEQVLASPQYGQHWGRHWLDIARYADTRGYAVGGVERRFPYAYTYRDYVVDALNQDLPYDRFIIQQIAADKLNLKDNKKPLAAMGFLTVGRRSNTRDEIDDRIDVVTRGLMGITAACARCHDHKYDPIPAADYYSLYGVFASSTEPAEKTIIGLPRDQQAYQTFLKGVAERKKRLTDYATKEHQSTIHLGRQHAVDYFVRVASSIQEKQIQKLPFLKLNENQVKPNLVGRWKNHINRLSTSDPIFGPFKQFTAYQQEKFSQPQIDQVLKKVKAQKNLNPVVLKAIQKKPPRSKVEVGQIYGTLFQNIYANAKESNQPSGTDALRKVLLNADSPSSPPQSEFFRYASITQRNKYRQLERSIVQYEINAAGAPPRAMSMVDKPNLFNPYVFLRGQPHRRGKRVPRQFLRIVSHKKRVAFKDGSGRLGLAKSIVAKENPLTARVMVNRMWMHYFGTSLVDSPSDFGLRSSPPSHPLLLDYLAHQFQKNNWSLKSVHRIILLSSTYRQQSMDHPQKLKIDPENRLIWKMNRKRRSFESMRDSILKVSGRLDLGIGGRPVKLTQPPYPQRRTIYGYVDRQDLPNLFRVFDFASPDQSIGKRSLTTVPQQALFFMNSPFVAQQANYLAARSKSSSPILPAQSKEDRCQRLYQLTLARGATPDEIKLAKKFIATQQPEVAWVRLAQALLMTNEFMFID